MKGYCHGFVHVVRQGETLYSISRRYRIPLALILRSNPYVDVYNMQIGQEICIPVISPFRQSEPGQQGRRTENEMTERNVPGRFEEPMSAEIPEMAEVPMNADRSEDSDMSMSSKMAMSSEMNEMAKKPKSTESPEYSEMQESSKNSVMPEMTEMSANPVNENEKQKEVYITESKKSLGNILDEFNVSMEEFTKDNDLSQIMIAEDVVIHLPKKV